MKPAEIYGLMMIRGISAGWVARQEGVHVTLVRKAIQGQRHGPAARRVLRRIARELDLDPAELGAGDEARGSPGVAREGG